VRDFLSASHIKPDSYTCAERSTFIANLFTEQYINLQCRSQILIYQRNWKVVGEKKLHLEVSQPWLENAFQHSPPYSTVTIDLEDDGNLSTQRR